METVRPADVESGGAPPAPAGSRWFWPVIAAVVALGVVLRFLILADYLAHNPLAAAPRVDALTYWQWAGRIAAGYWRETTPFFSAPLYPYLIGLLRALGAGLPFIYALQILIDGLTAILIATLGRRYGGPATGVIAAALFLLLRDPASFSVRILTSTLQLVLLASAWHALLHVQRQPTVARSVLAGLALGLLCLSYPPATLLLMGVVAWLIWLHGGRGRGWVCASAAGVAAALLIAPATLHNYLASGGDFFAIQSVSAVNLHQGNFPGAEGVIGAIPGFSSDREHLFAAAQLQYERATGRVGTWGDIQRYHRDQVLAYWRAEPVRTLQLFGRKAWWFLTGVHYSDIYNADLERATGLTTRWWLTPLAVAWLLPLSLVTVATWLRAPRRHLPALLMFGIPLFTVVVFWYTPRYRLPAIPVVVVAAAYALVRTTIPSVRRRWLPAVGAAVLITAAAATANRAWSFDQRDAPRAHFEQSVAASCADVGRDDEALAHYRAALALDPANRDARLGISAAWRHLGHVGEAAEVLRDLLADAPDFAAAHNGLGICLAQTGRLDEAIAEFEAALRLDPHYAAVEGNLANALLAAGRPGEAIGHYRAALGMSPDNAPLWLQLGHAYHALGRSADALDSYWRAIACPAPPAAAFAAAGRVLLSQGDFARAAEVLRAAHDRDPSDPTATNDLAWLLATCPVAELRDPGTAVRLAREAAAATQRQDANVLDTLAAAYAASGGFDDAIRTAEEATARARATSQPALAEEIESRRARYVNREPYRLSE